ncbi:hypothetical protein Cob_v001511 [Colletotrichum orbiculare MAFF 240422]|uniref:C2H2-type domain-containing protein n=1 Tax=Colletotrichum orbiculare (strain 104-T / ATCC 96160 / CBS 514.97 / LARS 414 / MAFF 240422) TaxID=1213857 RepID=A0A484G630_COLOR|nr:hypothetical protein Cob_v001511 [Colletotrichum orbiculare MAFF 240422]
MDGSISKRVVEALSAFEHLLQSVREADQHSSQSQIASNIHDELGRFKVWAGSSGAHRTGRASLEHRLRDASHIRNRVIELIGDLQQSLDEATAIVTGHATPWDEANDDEEPVDELVAETEVSQITLDIAEVVDCLLRLSVSIRNPAPHDRFIASAPVETSAYEQYDIQHVYNKFDEIPEYLAERLGKAISRRRQYFKYREAHHLKIASGLCSHGDSSKTEIIPSTQASSIPNDKKQEHSRDASGDDALSDAGNSQTSYATSVANPKTLKVPPMPDEALKGPFQCPFCFMIIAARNTGAWKKHVYGYSHGQASAYKAYCNWYESDEDEGDRPHTLERQAQIDKETTGHDETTPPSLDRPQRLHVRRKSPSQRLSIGERWSSGSSETKDEELSTGQSPAEDSPAFSGVPNATSAVRRISTSRDVAARTATQVPAGEAHAERSCSPGQATPGRSSIRFPAVGQPQDDDLAAKVALPEDRHHSPANTTQIERGRSELKKLLTNTAASDPTGTALPGVMASTPIDKKMMSVQWVSFAKEEEHPGVDQRDDKAPNATERSSGNVFRGHLERAAENLPNAMSEPPQDPADPPGQRSGHSFSDAISIPQNEWTSDYEEEDFSPASSTAPQPPQEAQSPGELSAPLTVAAPADPRQLSAQQTHVGATETEGRNWKSQLFQCPFGNCSRSFAYLKDLHRHVLSHMPNLSMSKSLTACHFPGCRESFTRADNLARHMQHRHRGVAPESRVLLSKSSKEEDTVRCLICRDSPAEPDQYFCKTCLEGIKAFEPSTDESVEPTT